MYVPLSFFFVFFFYWYLPFYHVIIGRNVYFVVLLHLSRLLLGGCYP